MHALDTMIEEKLVTGLKGFVAFPDDVQAFVMPLVREAVEEWQAELLRHAAANGDLTAARLNEEEG